MNRKERYRALVQAIRILDSTQLILWQEEATSPAWRMVLNARDHLQRLAETELRDGPEEDNHTTGMIGGFTARDEVLSKELRPADS